MGSEKGIPRTASDLSPEERREFGEWLLTKSPERAADIKRTYIDPPKPPDPSVTEAHALVRDTCESWRRSLFVNGPTDHLHHFECTRIAEAMRRRDASASEMYDLLREWSGALDREEPSLVARTRALLSRINGREGA